MVDEPDTSILQLLRRMDAKINRMADDIRDLKARMTKLEEAFVGLQWRFDRLEIRVEPIERRLDLVDSPMTVRNFQVTPDSRTSG